MKNLQSFSPQSYNHPDSDYHQLVKQLQELIYQRDVRDAIDEEMSDRVQKVLKAYRQDQKGSSRVLKERRLDCNKKVNNCVKDKVNVKHGKSTQKSSLSNTKSKGLIKKQLIMLPKFYKQQQSSDRRSKSKSLKKSGISRSISVKSGLTVTNNMKSKSKLKSNILKKSKSKEKENQRVRKTRINTQIISRDDDLLFNDDVCEYGNKEIEFLNYIKEKEFAIEAEKGDLQGNIQKLKDAIQEQKLLIEDIQKEISYTGQMMNSLQNNSQQVIGRNGCVDKKLGDLWSQVKILKQSYDGTIKQNEEVKNNLKEEKELILMYKTVIEQLRSQLKIEKSERDEKKKQLRILKKTEEASKIKYKRVNCKNDGLMDRVKKSMDKWN